MKKTVKEEKYFCDVCGREDKNKILDVCVICGKDMCWSCREQIYNVYKVDVCVKCYGQRDVTRIFEKYLNKWRRDSKKMTAELRKAIINIPNSKRGRTESG